MSEQADGRVYVDIQEAIRRIGDGENIHTFVQGGMGVLIGADWSRADILDLFAKYPDVIEETGPMAQAMGHGLALWRGHDMLFIETRGVAR